MKKLFEKYKKTLVKIPLFNNVSEEDLKSLLNCLGANIKLYDANSIVFFEGDAADLVGVVLDGSVQVSKNDYYGNRNIVANLDKGALFAESFACAEIDTLPVTVTTTKKSAILLVNYKKLITTCSNNCSFHNQLTFNMLKILAKKNMMINRKLDILTKKSTKDKIMTFLNDEALKSGNESFIIPFNRQQLADYLNVNRSSMSKQLSDLRDEGVLEFSKNKFKLNK